MTKYILIQLFLCDQNNIDCTAYNLCYIMWGTVIHHQLHHNNTHEHLYLVYFIYLTALTSANYILQTATATTN